MKPRISQPTIRSVIPHLIVAGAAQALEFYQKAFGAVPGNSMPTPDGTRLIHADMTIGGQVVYLVDEFPENHACGRSGEGRPVTGQGSTQGCPYGQPFSFRP